MHKNLLVQKKCFRFFVRYNNYDDNITTSLIKLTKLTGYAKHFEEINLRLKKNMKTYQLNIVKDRTKINFLKVK